MGNPTATGGPVVVRDLAGDTRAPTDRSSTDSRATQMDAYEYIDMTSQANQYETPVFDTSGDYERPYTTLN